MIHILNTQYCILDDVIQPRPGQRVELDLGCGSGGFTVALAKSKPDALIFGADVMLGRLRKVEKLGKRNGVSNMELLRVEARHLMSLIVPDSYFDRVHILCPDPWPKHKHKGNRLMAADFIGMKPETCLVVEDAKAGIQAAVAGGFDSAGLGEAAACGMATYAMKTFGDLKGICG